MTHGLRGRSDHDQVDADARNERLVPVRGFENILQEGKEQYHDGTRRVVHDTTCHADTGTKQLDRGLQ
jgi:hypothetical protein